MERVLLVLSKIFNAIFVTRYFSNQTETVFGRLIRQIIYGQYNGYLLIGVVFLIIGFSIGIIKRIISS